MDISQIQKCDLLIQSYCNFVLNAELVNSKFVNSEYFNEMNFQNINAKNILREIGIDNQGYLLIALYTLLVIPKELFNYSENITKWLDNSLYDIDSDYKKQKDNLEHIRNSIAHSKVRFSPKNYIEFYDEVIKYGKTTAHYQAKLELTKIPDFLELLQKEIVIHIDKCQKNINS